MMKLKVFQGPNRIPGRELIWTSDREETVAVQNGRLMALQPGRAAVTARRGNPGEEISCQVYVYGETRETTLDKEEDRIIPLGCRIQLKPKQQGEWMRFQSSDPALAKVSKHGKVVFLQAGTITVSCEIVGDEGIRYTASTRVTAEPPQDFDASEAERKTTYIAHRGDLRNAPENTLPSFLLAAQKGAKAIECDVYETADGKFVISHDKSIRRMCGAGRSIPKTSLTKLRRYSVTAGANISQYPGTVMPTVNEFLRVCNRYKITPVIELKGTMTEAGARSLEAMLSKSVQPVLLISFHRELLSLFQPSPRLHLQYICYVCSEEVLQICEAKGWGLSLDKQFLTEEQIRRIRERNIDLGVHWITTETLF